VVGAAHGLARVVSGQVVGSAGGRWAAVVCGLLALAGCTSGSPRRTPPRSRRLKNDLDQVDDLVDEFDFAVDESCVQYRECAALQPFTAQGKPVLHVEYGLSTAEFCPVTAPLGFRSIRKPVALTAPAS